MASSDAFFNSAQMDPTDFSEAVPIKIIRKRLRQPAIGRVVLCVIPNPDKPEQIATKAPRHKAKPLVNIHLWVFVSWWRKCFAIKCKEFTTKTLMRYLSLLRCYFL